MNLYCSFTLDFDKICVGQVGDVEARSLDRVESTLKYHPDVVEVLT